MEHTTLHGKNKTAGLSRGERQQTVFMEGHCGRPPSSQSVTDLHSEGRPSDRRHWARRCLNHFCRRETCKVTSHIPKKEGKNVHSLLIGRLGGPNGKEERKECIWRGWLSL